MIGEVCSWVSVPHVAVLWEKRNGACSTRIEYETNTICISTIDKVDNGLDEFMIAVIMKATYWESVLQNPSGER